MLSGMTAATPRGYTATKDQLQSRLRRIDGRVRAVGRLLRRG
jgi:DNA-binding FrmR family transcriptional regulator